MNFSIIIPCYNCEKTLARTVDSLLIQKDFIKQIILVDDGSKDKTVDIAKEYQEQHPDLIEYHYQKNAGPARARNHGAGLVKGEYALFLDSDDTLEPDALKTFTLSFENEPAFDIFIAGYCSIHGDTKNIKLPSTFHTTEQLIEAFWYGNFSLCGGATALRSHLLETVRYPEDITHGEDIVFFSHLLAGFPARILPFVALNVYHSPDSLRHATATVLSEGEAIVPLLFNPRYLSQELMSYQAQFHANHLISLARVANKLKQYAMARNYLNKAYRIYPASMYHFKPLKALLKSMLGA